MVLAIFFTTESLNVKTCHRTPCNSCGVISSGLFPPWDGPALILLMLSRSLLISLSAPPGRENKRSRSTSAGSAGAPPGPERDWVCDLARALSSSLLRSETDASLRWSPASPSNEWIKSLDPNEPVTIGATVLPLGACMRT